MRFISFWFSKWLHWCEFKFSLFFLSLCLLLHCIQSVKHCSISLNENFKSISSILCHSYTERLLYQVSKCLNWFSLSLSTNNNERFNARNKKRKMLELFELPTIYPKKELLNDRFICKESSFNEMKCRSQASFNVWKLSHLFHFKLDILQRRQLFHFK